MLSSGVSISEALTITARTAGNRILELGILKTLDAIRAGTSISTPLKETGIFPSMVIQMISTGEKTGKLDIMLEEVSAFYDPEIEYTIRNLTSLLEPFMLLAMGVMVAFIALSVLMPIFNLIKEFRN